MSHDHERGAATLVQFTHEGEQGLASMSIQVPGRLICEDQIGFLQKRPRHRDPLLLASGQLARLVMQPAPSPTSFNRAVASAFTSSGCRRWIKAGMQAFSSAVNSGSR